MASGVVSRFMQLINFFSTFMSQCERKVQREKQFCVFRESSTALSKLSTLITCYFKAEIDRFYCNKFFPVNKSERENFQKKPTKNFFLNRELLH